jgi:hypothetical protein
VFQDLFLDDPGHGAEEGGAALSLFLTASSLSGLTGPEERRLSAHSRETLEAPAETTAVAENTEHDAQATAAAASAILAAASPKRPSSLHLDILIVPYNLEEEKTLVIVMCFVFKRQFVQENT